MQQKIESFLPIFEVLWIENNFYGWYNYILFVVAYNMSEWKKFVKIIKTRIWGDILVLTVTFALTVIFDLVVAIAVGLALAVVISFIKKIVK